MVPYFLESGNFVETQTIGGFSNGLASNSFDTCFTEACDALTSQGINPLLDINTMIRNRDSIMDNYKETMLSGIMTESANRADSEIWGNYSNIGDQVSTLFDNCTDVLVRESTTVGQLMPIKAIDYPILVKQHLALATKDIMQTEVSKSPVVKKQIERKWIVDNQTGKRWEYPQCFFKEDYKEIFAAGKGLPIKNTPVELPVFNYNVIEKLTDAVVPGRETISFNTKIVAGFLADGTRIPLDMIIDLHTNQWLGGNVDKTIKAEDGTETLVQDMITGSVDFVNNTITLSSAAGVIKSVELAGYLSNQLNERAVSFDYTREEREWKIEDGHRVNVPYSVEELEDAKALLNMDLYKKTYDSIAKYLTDMEDSQVIDFLDREFEKYDGVELDPLGFNSFIKKANFDCDSTVATVALPSEFIEKQLKWAIDRFIINMTDDAKMEDMTFVMYGNPRYISLLGKNVNWVISNGGSTAGIRHNYSYGIMTTGNVKIQVVSALKFDSKAQNHDGLRIIPYPLNKEQMTFKHYKYTTHILTAQNSGYKAPDRPGGSMTNIMGVSRYESASVQGIQGFISFSNADFVK